MGKKELRRSLLKMRLYMSSREWREKSDRICHQLQTSPAFTRAKTILAYFSFRQEPDLKPLFSDTSRRWGFPRCVDDSLSWHLWQPGDNLQTGSFGICEPLPDAPSLHPSEVDLILVPAVACDLRGYRLGYGGGFYDRLLSDPEWTEKPTIGIVFAFAYLIELPIDEWDKRLTEVCTETSLNLTGNF